MPYDAYDPCPCNSTKKFKFCCQPIGDEIDKAESLKHNHQLQAFAQVCERLMRRKPQFAWSYLAYAEYLLLNENDAQSLEIVTNMPEEFADHPLRQMMQATGEIRQVGFEDAKATVYRALRQTSSAHPALASELARTCGVWHENMENWFAARQYYVTAIRFASVDQREQLFSTLLEFDGEHGVMPMVRCNYQLRPIELTPADTDSENARKLLKRAERAAAVGCFELAARAYDELLNTHSENANLAWNSALSHAWNADHEVAADRWHTAASLEDDSEQAIECESLAQLVEFLEPDEPLEDIAYLGLLKSCSRVMSLFDECPFLMRDDDESTEQGAVYSVIEPFEPSDPGQSELSAAMESLGRVRVAETELASAEYRIFARSGTLGDDESEDAPDSEDEFAEFEGTRRTSIITLFANPRATPLIEELKSLLREAGEEPPKERRRIPRSFPAALNKLSLAFIPPKDMPILESQKLGWRCWEERVNSVWMTTPQLSLDDLSPEQAAARDDFQIELAAAVNVLSDLSCTKEMQLDAVALRKRLQLPAPTPLTVDDDENVSNLSNLQLQRLKLDALTDEQLMALVNRCSVLSLYPLKEHVLLEVRNRESCWAKVAQPEVLRQLAMRAINRDESEQALQYIAEAREMLGSSVDDFRERFLLDFNELTIRCSFGDESEYNRTYQQFFDFYQRKVPNMVDSFTMLLKQSNLPTPQLIEAGGVSGTASAGGLWTPGDGSSPTDSQDKQKLWLPGQQG